MTGPTRIDAGLIRPRPVTIRVDDRSISAIPGEPVAAALLAAGIMRFRVSPRAEAPRGPFCFMGVCQECLAEIDGRLLTTCQEPVRAGMMVRLNRNG